MMSDDTAPRHMRLEGTTDFEAALDTVIARTTHRLRVFDRALSRSSSATSCSRTAPTGCRSCCTRSTTSSATVPDW